MDLNSLKVVGEQSIDGFNYVLPLIGVFAIAFTLFISDDDYILDENKLNVKSASFKIAVILALVNLIIFPISTKHVLHDEVRASVEVKLNDTKYTESTRESIAKKSQDNMESWYDGYLESSEDGKVYYKQKMDKKDFEEMKNNGTLKKYLMEGYKDALQWHVADAIRIESRNQKSKLEESYGNLTEEEKEKALKLYQKLKEDGSI